MQAIPATIVTFALIAAVFFGVAMLFLRSGRNQDVRTRSGRRRLIFGGLTRPLAMLLPAGPATREKLQRFLHNAGHYHRDALVEYQALRNALVFVCLAVLLSCLAVGLEPGDRWLVPTLVVGGVALTLCFALPRLMLESMAKSRLQRIEHDLPDALDMITMCTSGGLPLPAAIARVSEELEGPHPDLAYELRIVGRHADASSLDNALRRFADRVHTADVQSLAAIIGQTESQGAGVAGAFQDFADHVRLTRRQRADERGNKTALRLLFPVIFCLAPPVYLMLLAPAALELRQFVKREAQPGGVLGTSPEAVNQVMRANDVDVRDRRPDVSIP